jgi:hypothetical protein
MQQVLLTSGNSCLINNAFEAGLSQLSRMWRILQVIVGTLALKN